MGNFLHNLRLHSQFLTQQYNWDYYLRRL
jgi:hypothetical protein